MWILFQQAAVPVRSFGPGVFSGHGLRTIPGPRRPPRRTSESDFVFPTPDPVTRKKRYTRSEFTEIYLCSTIGCTHTHVCIFHTYTHTPPPKLKNRPRLIKLAWKIHAIKDKYKCNNLLIK